MCDWSAAMPATRGDTSNRLKAAMYDGLKRPSFRTERERRSETVSINAARLRTAVPGSPAAPGTRSRAQSVDDEYFASSSSIAATLPAERPFASKAAASQVSTTALASSGPTTRAPIVMIWALLLATARSAE